MKFTPCFAMTVLILFAGCNSSERGHVSKQTPAVEPEKATTNDVVGQTAPSTSAASAAPEISVVQSSETKSLTYTQQRPASLVPNSQFRISRSGALFKRTRTSAGTPGVMDPNGVIWSEAKHADTILKNGESWPGVGPNLAWEMGLSEKEPPADMKAKAQALLKKIDDHCKTKGGRLPSTKELKNLGHWFHQNMERWMVDVFGMSEYESPMFSTFAKSGEPLLDGLQEMGGRQNVFNIGGLASRDIFYSRTSFMWGYHMPFLSVTMDTDGFQSVNQGDMSSYGDFSDGIGIACTEDTGKQDYLASRGFLRDTSNPSFPNAVRDSEGRTWGVLKKTDSKRRLVSEAQAECALTGRRLPTKAEFVKLWKSLAGGTKGGYRNRFPDNTQVFPEVGESPHLYVYSSDYAPGETEKAHRFDLATGESGRTREETPLRVLCIQDTDILTITRKGVKSYRGPEYTRPFSVGDVLYVSFDKESYGGEYLNVEKIAVDGTRLSVKFVGYENWYRPILPAHLEWEVDNWFDKP